MRKPINAKKAALAVALPLTLSTALFVSPAHAQQPPASVNPVGRDTVLLSLMAAQRLALGQNPAFLAERQEQEIARGELRQARILAVNPEFELEVSSTRGLSGEGSEIGLFQEIEWAGQRGLRIRAAESGLVRAEYAVRDAARLTSAAASRAFYGALAAQRRLEVADEVLQLTRRLMVAVRIQLAEGEISTLEANLVEIETGRAEARVLSARREATSTELELVRLIGLSPAQAVRLDSGVPEPPSPDSLQLDILLQTALARRPDLTASGAAVAQFQNLARLARRETIPNLRLGALGERQEGTGKMAVRLGVGLPFPLWNRGQGAIAQREAAVRRRELERRAAELRVRTEVTDAYRAYLAASEEERIFALNVVRPARANQRLLDTAFREGKLDLPALLLLRNQLLDAELGYWEAWLARREALVELESTTATIPMPESGANDEPEKAWR